MIHLVCPLLGSGGKTGYLSKENDFESQTNNALKVAGEACEDCGKSYAY